MDEPKTQLDENLVVEKSKAFVWASYKDFSAGELKLFETYLAKIDPRDPESSKVSFPLAEYQSLLGVSDLRHEQVDEYTDKLIKNTVTIRKNVDDFPTFKKYALFIYAACLYDKEKKRYIIELECNPHLRDAFFDIARDGYTKYRLKNTVKMKSQYSIVLYSLLLDMIHIKAGWEINIDKLRELLGATGQSYASYKKFNYRVLQPAVAEINELTDIEVNYAKIQPGRTVLGVHFIANLKESKTAEKKRERIKQHIDLAACLPDLAETSAAKIADMVKRKVQELHPEIKDVDAATSDILKAAHKALLDDNKTYPDNPAGYLWSVLCKGSAIDEYLPYTYLFA